MKHLILGFLLAIPLTIFSQSSGKNFIDQNFIEVTGRAEMDIIPDMIYIKIILSDKDNKNKQSLEDIEKSMINKLKEIGIDISKDLSVKNFVSNFKQYWISKSDIILTKEYQLVVHDTKALQDVFFELQKMGISNVSIEKLDHSKIEQYRKEVKVNAIKAAKEKAEALTLSINQTIGKAIFIQELDNQNFHNMAQKNMASNSLIREESSGNSAQPDMEFEKINLQYSILVRFELK
jgi:uncharacterized protein